MIWWNFVKKTVVPVYLFLSFVDT